MKDHGEGSGPVQGTQDRRTTLSDFADDALLTTRQVAAWLGVSLKVVRRLGITPVPLRTREARYLAGDVKAFVTAKATRRMVPMRRSA